MIYHQIIDQLTMHCYNPICLSHCILCPAFVFAKITLRYRTQGDPHNNAMNMIHCDGFVGTSRQKLRVFKPEVHRCRLRFCNAFQRQLLAQAHVDGIVTSPDGGGNFKGILKYILQIIY